MKKIIIIGSGGHAGVVIDALHCMGGGEYEAVGLVDDFLQIGTKVHGLEVIGCISEIGIAWKDYPWFIAVGDIFGRRNIFDKMRHPLGTINVIHPRSTVSQLRRGAGIFGAGIFVGAGANIGPDCDVGNFSIVNTHASLDHNSSLGQFSHLAPGAVTGGHVKIGHHTLIGIGAMIRDHVTIGSHVTIGMGSVVLEDIPDNCTAFGNPARVVKREVAA